MTASEEFWLEFFSKLAVIGALIVIIGVILESADVAVSFSESLKWRKWFAVRFGNSRRAKLVLIGKYLKLRVFPYEALGFLILVVGLAIEIVGSFTAERLQSKENAILKKEAQQFRLKAAELEKEIQDANLKNSRIEAVTGLLIFDVDRDGMAWLNHRMFSITPGRKSFIDLYSQRFEAYVEIGLSSNIRTNNEIERSPIRLTTSLPPRYRDVDPEGHIERIIIQINGSEYSGRVGILDDLTNAMAAVRFNLSDGKIIRGYLGIKLNWWKTQWYSLSPHPELGEVGGSIFSGPALSSPPKIREISEL